MYETIQFKTLEQGVWCLGKYEKEKFLRIILELSIETKKARVHCLEKPYGINKRTTNLERTHISVA